MYQLTSGRGDQQRLPSAGCAACACAHLRNFTLTHRRTHPLRGPFSYTLECTNFCDTVALISHTSSYAILPFLDGLRRSNGHISRDIRMTLYVRASVTHARIRTSRDVGPRAPACACMLRGARACSTLCIRIELLTITVQVRVSGKRPRVL